MPMGRRFNNAFTVVAGLVALLFLSLLFAVSKGPVPLSFKTVVGIIIGNLPLGAGISGPAGHTQEVIVLLLRLPRAVEAAFVGGSLALSGVVIQSLFKNPMADPFVIGISSGASLGAAIAILSGSAGFLALPVMAFLGASIAAFIVYSIARSGRGVVVETLLLSGIAVAYFFSSITSFLLYTAGEALHQILFWLMGGLWGSSWTDIAVLSPVFGFSFVVLFFFSRDLNALLLGEEPAHHLGINVENLKKIILLFASLLAGVSVAFAGTIGFVGLIIPHMTRLLVGPDHRILLPSSALFGAVFLVWSDTLARTLIAPAEIPVGVITAFFGAPFFLYLLKTRRRGL